MVDTTFFFLCLGHGGDLFYCYPFSHIWADHARETQDGENPVCWLVQCNCDMLGDFVSCSCYLLSLDLVAAVLAVTTTKSDHLLLQFFAICSSLVAYSGLMSDMKMTCPPGPDRLDTSRRLIARPSACCRAVRVSEQSGPASKRGCL